MSVLPFEVRYAGNQTGGTAMRLGIINTLNLMQPIYQKTASYGHFGRELPEFTWEQTPLADTLRAAQ